MAITNLVAGVSLTTTIQTIVTNTAADGRVRTYELRFSNIDGTANCDITSCFAVDVSSSNAQYPLLPVGLTVERKDAVVTRVTLDPGDYVRANATASGDIFVTVTKIYEEAA